MIWMFRPPTPYLHQKLARPLPTTDRGTLRTVLDAREYMLSLLKRRELRGQWQRACELLLTGVDIGRPMGGMGCFRLYRPSSTPR
jgi:hypothetical protein